jgi:hypothetical protein
VLLPAFPSVPPLPVVPPVVGVAGSMAGDAPSAVAHAPTTHAAARLLATLQIATWTRMDLVVAVPIAQTPFNVANTCETGFAEPGLLMSLPAP